MFRYSNIIRSPHVGAVGSGSVSPNHQTHYFKVEATWTAWTSSPFLMLSEACGLDWGIASTNTTLGL